MTIFCMGTEGFDCSILWMVMIGLFFIAATLKKQITDFLSMEFNVIFSTIAGEILFIVMMLITKNIRWAFLAGFVGILIGGLFGGVILGGGGDSDYD